MSFKIILNKCSFTIYSNFQEMNSTFVTFNIYEYTFWKLRAKPDSYGSAVDRLHDG